jgi:hypothetical protein
MQGDLFLYRKGPGTVLPAEHDAAAAVYKVPLKKGRTIGRLAKAV